MRAQIRPGVVDDTFALTLNVNVQFRFL